MKRHAPHEGFDDDDDDDDSLYDEPGNGENMSDGEDDIDDNLTMHNKAISIGHRRAPANSRSSKPLSGHHNSPANSNSRSLMNNSASGPRTAESLTASRVRSSHVGDSHRLGLKRSKNGCLTCRGRKMKCGEEKPICRNCFDFNVKNAKKPGQPQVQCVWPTIPNPIHPPSASTAVSMFGQAPPANRHPNIPPASLMNPIIQHQHAPTPRRMAPVSQSRTSRPAHHNQSQNLRSGLNLSPMAAPTGSLGMASSQSLESYYARMEAPESFMPPPPALLANPTALQPFANHNSRIEPHMSSMPSMDSFPAPLSSAGNYNRFINGAARPGNAPSSSIPYQPRNTSFDAQHAALENNMRSQPHPAGLVTTRGQRTTVTALPRNTPSSFNPYQSHDISSDIDGAVPENNMRSHRHPSAPPTRRGPTSEAMNPMPSTQSGKRARGGDNHGGEDMTDENTADEDMIDEDEIGSQPSRRHTRAPDPLRRSLRAGLPRNPLAPRPFQEITFTNEDVTDEPTANGHMGEADLAENNMTDENRADEDRVDDDTADEGTKVGKKTVRKVQRPTRATRQSTRNANVLNQVSSSNGKAVVAKKTSKPPSSKMLSRVSRPKTTREGRWEEPYLSRPVPEFETGDHLYFVYGEYMGHQKMCHKNYGAEFVSLARLQDFHWFVNGNGKFGIFSNPEKGIDSTVSSCEPPPNTPGGRSEVWGKLWKLSGRDLERFRQRGIKQNKTMMVQSVKQFSKTDPEKGWTATETEADLTPGEDVQVNVLVDARPPRALSILGGLSMTDVLQGNGTKFDDDEMMTKSINKAIVALAAEFCPYTYISNVIRKWIPLPTQPLGS